MKIAVALLSCFVSSAVWAAPIEDNSFMIEEAYNQEEGVVQHILYYESHEKSAVDASFSEEFPLGSQTHQGAITLPYQELANPSNEKGLGDIELSYRYQLIQQENLAMAPSLSLILPTGDHKKDLGSGATGIQVLIPVSVNVSPKYATHFNVGYNLTPDAKNSASNKADIHGALFGSSLIYLYSDTLNFMAEFYGESNEAIVSEGVTETETELWFNPGLRYAVNIDKSQFVVGAAYLNGVGPSAGETGFSIYLSFEH